MKSATLTETEELELLTLLEQEDRERVAPKFEAWRRPARIKAANGGRGAGAKSWSSASLLVQEAQDARPGEGYPIVVVREIQKSMAESVHRLIWDTIGRLQYPGWELTEHRIGNKRNGCLVTFRGLKDMRANRSIKSLENVYRLWGEEASGLSHDSLSAIFPTIRRPGSELWFTFNREEEADPIYDRLWNSERSDAILLELLPGREDNPWWTEELEQERREDTLRDPDEAEHVWGGHPRSQGDHAAVGRTRIRGAMDRTIDPEGAIEIGGDVARFGDDLSIGYKRHGLKIVDQVELRRATTIEVAHAFWDLAGQDPSVVMKIDDTGVGGGVTDQLRDWGAKVAAINFGGKADDADRYPSIASEMWFEFPVDDADIPDDRELMRQLSSRRYAYDKAGRREIESKKDYKKRGGRSPDKADALLLCYYTGQNMAASDNVRAAMMARRARGH
ncbi:MAG: phage terminase large subunit [Gammaproteobacteria bacterium]|nr:phage terminase large subunit [Gammaproteobacteria bacterium]